MRRNLIKYSITAFAYLTVLYPLWIRSRTLLWTADFDSILFNLFPFFGLTAFTILWLHIMSAVFEPWLRRYLDFESFVRNTALIVLICIILHPLLLFIGMGSDFIKLFSAGGKYVWFGLIGWLLLLTYDLGKLLQRKYDLFVRHWEKILLISTLGFLITTSHALNLGHDLRSDPLRTIWIFYGFSGLFATIYVYGIRKTFYKNKENA